MAINREDGEFALDCWEDPDAEDVEAETDYSNDEAELRAHAQQLLAAGRFRYLALSRWNERRGDWDELSVLTA